MRNDAEFTTVEHNTRGQPQQKYADANESAPRSLYGFAGLLAINVMTMFKQYAFGERLVQPYLEDQTQAAHSSTAVNSARHAPPAPVQDASNDEVAPARNTSGSRSHEYVSAELPMTVATPLPSLSAWREGLHAASPAVAVGHANDNAAVRLPLDMSSNKKVNVASGVGAAPRGSEETPVDGDNEDQREPEGTQIGADETAGKDEAGEKRNRAPSIADAVNLGELALNTALIIGLSDLLAHASDVDGDALNIANLQASSGQLQDQGDGTWVFVPDVDDVSAVTFNFDVTDGDASVAQTAYLDLVELPAEWMLGTDNEDVIVGTSASDQISTKGSSDIVHAMAGDDVVDAGAGDDVIVAGDGNDIVDAGDGNDIVFAGAGDDIVFGGAGNDIIFGENGNDELYGGSGNDEIYGGDGNDAIEGGLGDDIAAGDYGNDVFVATHGSSAHVELASRVELPTEKVKPIGTDISDLPVSIQGAQFSATEIARSSQISSDGNDSYDGGEGNDTLDISATSADAIVDLSTGFAESDEIGRDELSSIENVICGSGNDTLVANGSRNELTGGGGEDTFVFLEAEDSQVDPEECDRIADFEVGDRIDVSHIDSDEGEDGSQLFYWKGDEDHFEKAGELRYKHESQEDGDHTIVLGNTNDDEEADFMIDLVGWIELTQSDLIGVY